MKNFLVIFLALAFCFPKISFAQAPNLGIVSSFVLYSTAGAINSSGATKLTGNIGNKNAGAMEGLNATNVTGNIYNQVDSVTTQCERDLQSTYTQLRTTVGTMPHASINYGNETLLPGVYDHTVAEACYTAGTLTLDANFDSSAIFIIKINGALTTSASFKVLLKNQACACNVFWLIEGALTLGANNVLIGTFIVNNGAIDAGISCRIEGRVITTTGAITISALTGYVPVTNRINYWTGGAGTSNWFTNYNWTMGVPDTLSSTLIPASINVGRFFPVIDTGYAQVSKLTIQKGASLIVKSDISASSSTAKLMVSKDILNLGNLDVCYGTLEFMGDSIQTLPLNFCLNNSIKNLIISNSTTLAGIQNITGTLSFTGSKNILQTNGLLTLKSTALGTAQLADITNAGKDSLNVIVGTIIIERYIPAKRAWRLLSVPISSYGAPTINAAWQEGSNSASIIANPNPGYGTQITTGSASNGYDLGINSNPSVKVYDTAANTFSGLPLVPGTLTPITSYPAYFMFIRGDRSTNLQQGTGAALSNTTLRMQGNAFTGSDTVIINARNFTLISNPFPAAINFHTITKKNVGDVFYLWDPKQGNFGAYICFSWNSLNNNYDYTSSASALTQYIASGDAFFLPSANGSSPGEIIIKETDKNNLGSDNVFRPMATTSSMRVNLSALNILDSSASLIDGVLTSFADNNSNAVDNNDVRKMYNMAENICLGRENKLLAIEKRLTINSTDTSFIKLYLLKKQSYQLAITAGSMSNGGYAAILKDKYDSTINNRILDINGIVNKIIFTVNADSSSFAADRFSIVFTKTLVVLPLQFDAITAVKQIKNVLLSFKVSSELNSKEYIIETAVTANQFLPLASIAAKLNNGKEAAYSWLQLNATEGIHYYRVKSISNSGAVNYSSVVQILMQKDLTAGSLNIYPNIISNNTIAFKLNNIEAGNYLVQLINMSGQLIENFSFQHDGNNDSRHEITIGVNIAKGKYLLQLNGNATKISAAIIKE